MMPATGNHKPIKQQFLTNTFKSYFIKFQQFAALFRWPNLLIVFVTQLMLRYFILIPFVYRNSAEAASPVGSFLLLVLITVLIAMGGYVINDYFDQDIDKINRPDGVLINRVIERKTAIKIHLILNGIAILLGFYLAWRVRATSFGLVFPFISGLLWIYSTKYKREFFWGNFIVASTTSMVIIVVLLYEFFWLRLQAFSFMGLLSGFKWTAMIFGGYAIFAFLMTMVREIVKDMEDLEGDSLVGCKTIPVVLGISRSKYIVAGFMVVMIGLLGYAQVILLRMEMVMGFWYLLVTVQTVAVFFLVKIYNAHEKQAFHNLSTICKVIMVAGIISMQIIYISN